MEELYKYLCSEHVELEDMVNCLEKKELDDYQVVIITVSIHVDRILRELSSTTEHYRKIGMDKSERLGGIAQGLNYSDVYKLSQKLLDHKLVDIIVRLKKE